MNENLLQWDDLKTVLAIFRAGGLARAARALGLSHATLYRHLGEIERRLGVRLFARARSGYLPTPACEALIESATHIEHEIHTLERRIVNQDIKPIGTLRLTTMDALLEGLLTPLLTEFRQLHPQIELEVAVSNQLFDLSRREADVALRPSLAPPERLIGWRLAGIAQAVYLAAALDAQASHDWIGADEGMHYCALERWMQAQKLHPHYRVDSLLGMRAAARAGLGKALLPCYLAECDASLQRIGTPVTELSSELWLLTHPELRGSARIKAFCDFVRARVVEQRFQPRVLDT